MTEIQKTENKLFAASSLFLLACLLAPFVGLVSKSHARSRLDRVYCPLQESWVKKSQPSQNPGKKFYFFDRICAAENIKVSLATHVFARVLPWQTITSTKEAEDLIFDYLDRGVSAVKAFSGSRNLPSDNLSGQRIIEKALNDFRNFHLAVLPSIAFNPHHSPRPPSRILISTRYIIFYNSSKFSIHLSPRPPPFS